MQKNAIEEWILKNPEYDKGLIYYEDKGLSGASTKRPAFNALIQHCNDGLIRCVICYKLDRLTRDAMTGIRTILRFDELGIEFISVSQAMFNKGMPFRHAIIAIFAELAQMERETIVERVKAGLDAAKKRGVRLGRPKAITEDQETEILRLRELGLSIAKISHDTGISNGAVHAIIKKKTANSLF